MISKTYTESVKESGNYLRSALKNIAKYKLPYNPVSYLLWYEYALGRNKDLIDDIELIFKKNQLLTNDTIAKLFKKHITDNQILISGKKIREFQNILAQMTKHLSQSGDEIGLQGNMLDTYAIELGQASSLDAIIEISKHIVLETKSIVESSRNLKSRLDSTISEINMLSKELDGIRQAAKTDMLTGLLNRRGFYGAMVQAIANIENANDTLSVIMLDIDHFKRVNDQYGHLIGDNVLKILSKLLKDHIKGKDIAARFGGEEFILVLPQTSLEGAYALAEQIRLSLLKMNWKIKDTGKSIGQITISLGISLYQEGESIEAVIKRADDALYHAKNNGRNKSVTEVSIANETS
ncbi:GGDEF domain-containing protein [Desulfobacula phenolica]|uniref:diguanylate cyclase n=1 Tax=Desulfobacula phenolica TaxID=90732 RepID=A0A1H2INK5_9BACT|nr:GGDEF domain-containing protein [Desulfobacula phenolica]SDU45632.1 diguanylate cyclase [Desulfobacula phenolica]